MTVFWLVVAFLIVAALLFVIPPLFRRENVAEIERRAINVTIYKNQLAELEADLAASAVSQEQYAKSRQEIERRLLEDAAVTERGASTSSKGLTAGTAIFTVVAVPVMAVWLYSYLGNLDGLAPEKYAQQTIGGESPHGDDANMAQQIEAMVLQLAQRLSQNPQDIEGWVMLGRSYSVLGRYQEAVQAYEKAIQFVGEDPGILADYADAIAMANGGSLEGKALQLLKKSVSIDPSNQKALWLIGTALFERGDFVGAIEHWTHLQSLFAPGSEDAASMGANIAEARSYRERQLAGEFGPAPQTTSLADTMSAGGDSSVLSAPATVSGTVIISDALADQFDAGDTLFVFAKASNGPPMPLAIIRAKAGDLPLEFTLDESMAMMPTMSLAKFDEVVVGARISKGGDAIANSGDLQGELQSVAVGSNGLEIRIDSVVP